MGTPRGCRRPIPGEWAGAAAILAAAALGWVDLRLAAVPLAMFVTACLIAPFLPALRAA